MALTEATGWSTAKTGSGAECSDAPISISRKWHVTWEQGRMGDTKGLEVRRGTADPTRERERNESLAAYTALLYLSFLS